MIILRFWSDIIYINFFILIVSTILTTSNCFKYNAAELLACTKARPDFTSKCKENYEIVIYQVNNAIYV